MTQALISLLSLMAAILAAVLCGLGAYMALGWQVGTAPLLALTIAVFAAVLALLAWLWKGGR